MKKIIIGITLAAWAIGVACADGAVVTVQNQENLRFWYVLDPPGFSDEEPGSPWLTMKASTFLGAEGSDFPFVALGSGETATLTELSQGTHYLLGFFEDDSLEEFPVRLIALQADSAMASRHYDVYTLPELMMAARGQGMLVRFGRGEMAAAVEEPSAEAVEEPAAEAAEEPAAEAVEEPVVEEVVAEEPAAMEAVAEAVEEPAAEAVEEPAAEAVEEPAVEAVEEPVVEEVVAEEPAATEAVAEAVEEPAAEEVVAEEPAAMEAVAEAAEEPAVDAVEEPVGPVALAYFADTYDPVYFTSESRDGFVVMPIASSRTWGRPGTRLSELSGSLEDGMFTLVLQSPDGFAQNVSCFLYVFPERSAGEASQYTFEAKPDAAGRAAVVLWQKGQAIPRIIGTARTEGGTFTWTAHADELPPDLAQGLGPGATLDLTTAWLDETSGTWEEFYFVTFAVADLTR